MRSPRAPLYVFFAAFMTFLVAFSSLLIVLRTEVQKRRLDVAHAPAATHVEAALVPHDPVAPSPRSDVGSTAASNAAGKHESNASKLRVSGRLVDAHGDAIVGAHVHLFANESA